MKSKSVLVLFACLVLLVVVLLLRQCGGGPGGGQGADGQADETNKHVAAAHAGGKDLPLHQSRLNAELQRQVDADPAAAVTANPRNLDLLVVWAARDPKAALAWINGHAMTWQDDDGDPVSYAREQLLGAIAAGILLRDGAEAMKQFIAEHQEDPAIPPKNQGELLKYAMFNLGRADTIEAAMPLMQGEDGAALAGMMILGVKDTHQMTRAIDYLEAKGIPVEVDYWAFQSAIDSDPRYWADWAQQRESDLLVEIVHGWNRDQPDEVRAWLNERLPATDPRRKEIEELISPVD